MKLLQHTYYRTRHSPKIYKKEKTRHIRLLQERFLYCKIVFNEMNTFLHMLLQEKDFNFFQLQNEYVTTVSNTVIWLVGCV
jgi:hypothetical protein